MSRKQRLAIKKEQKKINKLKQRRATAHMLKNKGLYEHIEKMVAAYTTETNIPASQACLVHQRVTEGDTTTTKYWFEHHEERAKIVDVHPDIMDLFEIAYDLNRAQKLENEEEKKELTDTGLKLIAELVAKYGEIVDEEVKEIANNG